LWLRAKAVEEDAVIFAFVFGGNAALASGCPPHEAGVREGRPRKWFDDAIGIRGVEEDTVGKSRRCS
jgi:hypothetical protein